MIKAVVFDLGKVLLDFDYGVAAKNLAKNSSRPAGEIRPLIDQSPLLLRYERAQITTTEFFAAVRESIGFRGAFDDFAAAFADIFTEVPDMTQLNRELRERGVPTFVLSNTNEIAISHIRHRFPFFTEFSGYIFSFEHGVLKPEPRIYEIAGNCTGCRGSEILFLDDNPANVEGALKAGWRTICHRAPGESVEMVRELIN